MYISAELNAPLSQNGDFWLNTRLKSSIASRQLLQRILSSQEVKYTVLPVQTRTCQNSYRGRQKTEASTLLSAQPTVQGGKWSTEQAKHGKQHKRVKGTNVQLELIFKWILALVKGGELTALKTSTSCLFQRGRTQKAECKLPQIVQPARLAVIQPGRWKRNPV